MIEVVIVVADSAIVVEFSSSCASKVLEDAAEGELIVEIIVREAGVRMAR